MKRKAFSLIELSVVLVIIATLTVGLVQSGNLVKLSRLSGARSFTAKSPVPNIPDLIAWYETSMKESFTDAQAINDGGPTEWRDISPNSIVGKKNKLTRTVAGSGFNSATKLYYKSNGIGKVPTLQFSGANFTLQTFSQGTSNQATVFTVFRQLSSVINSAATTQTILDSYVDNSSTAVAVKNLTSVNLYNSSGVDATSTFVVGKDYVVAAYFNTNKSGAYVNNVKTLAGGANVTTAANPINGLTIGSDKAGNNFFDGFISEIIIYGRPLKLQERRDVMNYLSKKYQIYVSGL